MTQESIGATATSLSEEDNETWYDTIDGYNGWHDAIKTMDNHQEWADPPTTEESGYEFLISILYKFIYFLMLCAFQAKITSYDNIVHAIETLSEAVISTPIAIYKWFNKPRTRRTKKYHKASNGSGKFSHKLRNSKKSCYHNRNCKTGRHGRRHTFMQRNFRTKRNTTNDTSQDLKIKGRKIGTFKSPF